MLPASGVVPTPSKLRVNSEVGGYIIARQSPSLLRKHHFKQKSAE
jgi:hypothetical protein